MEKERVLVRDNKSFFLKMFKRRFKAEFDFFAPPFLNENQNEQTEFDRSIYVIYDKFELAEFLKADKKESNVLVCLFDTQLYDSLSFREEMNSVTLLDCTRTRVEIIKELKIFFSNKTIKPILEMRFPVANIIQTQFSNFYKRHVFFM